MSVDPTRPWFKSYDSRTAHSILDIIPENVLVIVEESIAANGSKPAFTCLNDTITYDNVNEASHALAAFMQKDVGLSMGDRVAIALPNFIAFPVTMMANIFAGHAQVNVNPMYTTEEMEHQLNDSGSEVLVVGGPALATFAKIAKETSVKKAIVVSIPGFEDIDIPGVETVSFDEATSRYTSADYVRPDVSGEDLLYLQYTGGTTGFSKGAMLTHYNLAANITQANAWLFGDLKLVDAVVITALPLYHIFALMVNTLTMFTHGAHNILVPNPADMPGFVDTMKKYPPTIFTGVNTLYNGLLMQPNIGDIDFSKLLVAIGGGAPVQEVVSGKWRDITGQHILEAYGLSETSPLLTSNIAGRDDFKSSIGLPVADTDISIRDDDGNEVPTGSSGELCASGPQIMAGYWGQAEKTAEVMYADGYFKTGDIAVMDASGYFKIVDRKKDMVLVSGFNVFPNEIEDHLSRMEGVVECACIGVPDDRTGEAVKVFVVAAEGSDLSANRVRDYCRTGLTGYKIPKQVTFLEALPKSTVGKILRRELRNY